MAIFIAGGPFFYFILRDSDLQGRRFFMWAYALLMLSNIFTVVEEFWLNSLFNTCEHSFIAIGSIMILVAVLKLTTEKRPNNVPRVSDDTRG
ncbi:MAG: hypothetical protein PVG41_02715 [Desulfobacteraceae bacterium]